MNSKKERLKILKHIRSLCSWKGNGCIETKCVFYDKIGKNTNVCPFVRESIRCKSYQDLPCEWTDEDLKNMKYDKQIAAWKIYFTYYLIKKEKTDEN